MILSKDTTIAWRSESMLDWLVSNEYWRRVWILQEVVLSEKDPICLFGVHQIPLLSLDTVLGSWDEDHRSANSIPERLRVGFARALEVCLLRDETTTVRHFELVRCLYFTSHRNATQAVDHVWGIRGILSREDQALLPPDFDMSTADLYATVTKTLLHRTGSTDVLCASAGVAGCGKHGLPSWALDMSKPLQFPASIAEQGTADMPLPAESPNLGILSVEARRLNACIVAVRDQQVDLLDTLARLDSAEKRVVKALDDVYEDLNHNMGSTLPDPAAISAHAIDTTTHLEAHSARLEAGLSRYKMEKARIEAEHSRYTQTAISQFLGSDEPLGLDVQDLLHGFYAVIQAPVYPRFVHRNQPYAGDDGCDGAATKHMFYTTDGRVGKCLHGVEVGDGLWMLPGSRTLFVLRPIDTSAPLAGGTQQYRLVGPCVCSESSFGPEAQEMSEDGGAASTPQRIIELV